MPQQVTRPSGICDRTGTGAISTHRPSRGEHLHTHPSSASASWTPAVEQLRFALVGAGRLGTALALALTEAGATLTAFASGSEASRRRGSALLGVTATVSLEHLVVAAVTTRVDLLLLAVPDASLPAVATEVGAVLTAARAASSEGESAAVGRLVVAHTSGATSLEILAPCRQAGASTLGFHPLQTFSDPVSGVARLRGCTVAVTAADPQAAALADLVAGAVGAEPFALADEDRVLYHAAAVVAGNYLVTLASVAEDLFARAGLPPARALPALLPLMQGALDNMQCSGHGGGADRSPEPRRRLDGRRPPRRARPRSPRRRSVLSGDGPGHAPTAAGARGAVRRDNRRARRPPGFDHRRGAPRLRTRRPERSERHRPERHRCRPSPYVRPDPDRPAPEEVPVP